MKIYLVGGAVRDKLLNLPTKEHDWVVVGATPQQLLQQGYKQVGKDFPVFLHPLNHEEYALARTEKKLAPGYYGFVCDSNNQVTLEEDLKRRDLTINAMAMDEHGTLIDPYNGRADLNAKILRHVSPAFREDPLRVLRVARFAARFYHLGFKIAAETRALMYDLVTRGELQYLIAERIWQEWQQSLGEKNPEVFITTLRNCDALRVILPEINNLFGIPNPKRHHPEIDSGIHSLMVLQRAAELSLDPSVRFAACVHDLGKAATPMAFWPHHYGHDKKGIPIIAALVKRLKIPTNYSKLAAMTSRFHLIVHRAFELRPKTLIKVLTMADAFRRPNFFQQMLVVCAADAYRVGNPNDYSQNRYFTNILEECAGISIPTLLVAGHKGNDMKDAVNKCRIAAANRVAKLWKIDER